MIIPAHNAAATLDDTLNSLQAQSSPDWEAVIVDDGSSDETATRAAAFAERDPRFRLIQQTAGGVSSARNCGLSYARHQWVLFLDADDWIAAEFIEVMTAAVQQDPQLDAAYCDSARVTTSGAIFKEESSGGDEQALFLQFAQRCVFAVHSCVVRRSLVLEVGGFDRSLRTCEDWDLWQRIARAGARFKRVRKTLAFYRMRCDSASNLGNQLAIDGVAVIERGHTCDPRVVNPAPAHQLGASRHLRAAAQAHFLCYSAGLIIGSGGDVSLILDLLPAPTRPLGLDPHLLAGGLMVAAILPSGQPLTYWLELWPRIEQPLLEFLVALQQRAQAPHLVRRVRRLLERDIIQNVRSGLPVTIGLTYGITIDASAPLQDIIIPFPVERISIAVEMEGTALGELYLPVIDGQVSQWVIADVISARFAWTILRKFFEQTVYPTLLLEEKSDETKVFRGKCELDAVKRGDARPFWEQAHDAIGWTILLQELWDMPMWPWSRFYKAGPADKASQRDVRSGEWLEVEIVDELPNVYATGEVSVAVTLGGSPVFACTVSPAEGTIGAADLRTLITTQAGTELLRISVREALIARPFSTGGSLRERLQEAAREARQTPVTTSGVSFGPEVILAPNAFRFVAQALWPSRGGAVLGRRNAAETGSGVSRRAQFPAATASEMLDLAASSGTPALRWEVGEGFDNSVAYVPEILWKSAASTQEHKRENRSRFQSEEMEYFERFFSEGENPWDYDSPYEQTKYLQTLDLLPQRRLARAIEIGCAEGHFTVQLAPRVDELIAADIAPTALRRAARRCAMYKHIQYERLNLVQDRLSGRFDLIVCSEILYYVGDKAALAATARKLADALNPGGYLLTAHANLVVDEPDRTGFNWDAPFGAKVIAETFATTRPLKAIRELRTSLYRISLYRRDPFAAYFLRRRKAQVTVLDEVPRPLPPEVEMQVLWGGGPSLRAEASDDNTSQLPILMYHRVAPTGAEHTARYRVTPAALIKQMQFLRRKGFYSVTLEQWHTARITRTPLKGRAIIITFDDGYRDFAEHAWPILRLHGFGALVFLVSDCIGKSNEWDAHYGEELPLMGWDEIRDLTRRGVQFGAHSATHPSMTALTAEQIVVEAARCRSIIQRKLGVSVYAFAYPYGDEDPAVHHLVEGCGFRFGLSCRPGRSTFDDDPLALRRIEIAGDDSIETFAGKIGF